MTEGTGPGRAAPAGYPEHWEADVLLADGGAVHVRPSAATDGPAILAMHERMSARTRYLRYFQAVAQLSPAQLSVFTDVDHVTAVGLVAELGGQIIAAGSYHRSRSDPASAEVAFVVEDGQQRRGLGSILLEHLAAAAQERGIGRFTAEVLGENQAMVRVFLDAGYSVTREFSSGIVDLEFDINPTAASRAVLVSREQRAEARSIARLLAPRAVAVIGASNETRKLGHAMLANLLAAGFTGPVFPVNPETVSVQGVRAYPSVLDIPDPVDIAVVTVPAASVAEVMESCRMKGVHGLVVVTGGFADADVAGADGADAQRRMVAMARSNGMRVVGPNCLGLVNTDPAVRLNATLAAVVPPPGRVGFFCQSGALGIAILADAATRRLGLSSFVSAGNRADVSGNDLLQFWQGDERTEVVLLYLESFGNPRKFARLARTLARSKPVIAVKSGRHALVSPGLAASSATVSDTAVATLFAQSGVIRTDTLSEAFDTAQLLANQPVPTGNRVAILGNSTALGVLALDSCLDAGLEVVDEVPVDFGVDVSPEQLGAAVEIAVRRTDVDAVVVVFVPPVATPGQAHAEALRAAATGSTVPVVTTFLAVDGLADALSVVGDDGGAARGSVPSYRTPERAVTALAHAVRYGRWRDRPAGLVPELDGVRPEVARELVDRIRDDSDDQRDRSLTDAELVALLDCYGITVADFRSVDSGDEAVAAAETVSYPVVLKAVDEELRHRLDQVGVRLALTDARSVRTAYDELAATGRTQVYVQRMAPADRSAVPAVLRIVADPSFGALISFGIGGVATELLGDLAFQAVPLTDADAGDLIDAPKAAPLLSGYRGAEVVDRAALLDLVLRLSALANDVPEISDLLLQPVLLGPAGVCVTGATARIGAPTASPDVRRRLR